MSKKIIVATTAGIFTLSAVGLGIYAISQPASAEEQVAETLENLPGDTKRQEMKTVKEEIEKSLEDKNYEAWKIAMAKLPNKGEDMMTKIDSEEKFQKLVKIHELRKEARAISEELGLDELKKEKFGKMKKFIRNKMGE